MFPVDEVVGVAPGGGGLTPRPLTLRTPRGEGPAGGPVPDARGPALVEDLTPPVGRHGHDDRVAEDPFPLAGVDHPGEHAHHHRMRLTRAAFLGQIGHDGPGTVGVGPTREGDLTDPDQALGLTLRQRRLVVHGRGPGERLERVAHGLESGLREVTA